MSDAPAAQVTDNGVPPLPQESAAVPETPGFKVFAGNLAYTTTDEGLRTHFAAVQDDIINAQVIQRRTRGGTRSAGYGFVALATAEAAQKAVDLLNNQELDGRAVIIEIAKPAEEKEREPRPRKTKKRAGRRGQKSVPGEVTDAEANGDAVDKPETVPGTDDAEKPKKKKKKSAARRNKSKGPSGDEGEATDLAQDGAASAEKKEKAKRVKTNKLPRTPRPAGQDPVGEPSKSVLFVANLGFNIEDAGLAALFTDAGIKVTSARIVRRRWGKPRRSKGYGFVDVGDEEEQKKAIEALQGKDIGGRPIAVKIAVNTPHDEADDANDGAPANATTITADREVTPEATVVAS